MALRETTTISRSAAVYRLSIRNMYVYVHYTVADKKNRVSAINNKFQIFNGNQVSKKNLIRKIRVHGVMNIRYSKVHANPRAKWPPPFCTAPLTIHRIRR